jgi:hypothetical protein
VGISGHIFGSGSIRDEDGIVWFAVAVKIAAQIKGVQFCGNLVGAEQLLLREAFPDRAGKIPDQRSSGKFESSHEIFLPTMHTVSGPHLRGLQSRSRGLPWESS